MVNKTALCSAPVDGVAFLLPGAGLCGARHKVMRATVLLIFNKQLAFSIRSAIMTQINRIRSPF
jgi:hypothetical protein